MDLVAGNKCAVCGASFPGFWKRPIHCNHRNPGRDWNQRQKAPGEVPFTPSHWTPLHQYPVEHWANWNPQAAASWFDGWQSRIPNYGCACRDNFKSYIESHPPDYPSADAFFRWTVDAHNYVSLNHVQPPRKPMTLDEARDRYGLERKRELS